MFTSLNTVALYSAAPRFVGALALAAVSLLIAVSPALADTPRGAEVPSITVRYADLNLDQAVGVQRLHKRLRAAAEQVCGIQVNPGSRFVSDAWKQCVDRAVGEAVAKVDRPALSAYHRGLERNYAVIQTASAQ